MRTAEVEADELFQNLNGGILCIQVALGLPILPKLSFRRSETKRRANMMLLPLGMALLGAQEFVEERLFSAEICKDAIGNTNTWGS